MYATVAMATGAASSVDLRNSWIWDSGTDSNVCNDLPSFIQYEPFVEPVDKLVSDTKFQVFGKGAVALTTRLHDGTEVRYGNLISTSHLESKDVGYDFRTKRLVTSQGKEWCQLLHKHGLYFAKYATQPAQLTSSLSASPSSLSMSATVMAIRTWPTMSYRFCRTLALTPRACRPGDSPRYPSKQ